MSPSVRSSFPSGQEGNAAFEHLFTTLVRRNSSTTSPPERIGQGLWQVGTTICLFEGVKCDFGDEQARDIKRSGALRALIAPNVRIPLESLALLKKALPEQCRLIPTTEHELIEQVQEFEPFAVRYLGPSPKRKSIEQLRFQYDSELAKLHGKIQFVGMSVYKIEASEGIPMDRIYIPLRVVPEAAPDRSEGSNPLDLLAPGSRHVILGDPGSGKSTLLRFIALVGTHQRLRERYGAKDDSRLCIYVALRRYGDALKSRPNLKLFDYIIEFSRLPRSWLTG